MLSAGSGVLHSEIAEPGSGPTRFLQTWVRPDEAGAAPSYASASVGDAVAAGGLVPVVSGHDGGAVARIGTASATLHAAVLEAGESVTLPDDPLQHVFVATGSLARSSLAEPLSAGDAFRISDRPGSEPDRGLPHRAAGLVLHHSLSWASRPFELGLAAPRGPLRPTGGASMPNSTSQVRAAA